MNEVPEHLSQLTPHLSAVQQGLCGSGHAVDLSAQDLGQPLMIALLITRRGTLGLFETFPQLTFFSPDAGPLTRQIGRAHAFPMGAILFFHGHSLRRVLPQTPPPSAAGPRHSNKAQNFSVAPTVK